MIRIISTSLFRKVIKWLKLLHPLQECDSYLLLSLYRSIFRSSIEYGAQIFNLNKNRALFLKLQRQQYRIIRRALGKRQSTPIGILLCEAREFPMSIRFSYLTSKYILKSLARKSNLVIQSLRRLGDEDQSRKKYT